MTLPLLISIPHAGLNVPSEVADLNVLKLEDIIEDGDEKANEIYNFKNDVIGYVSTGIARAYVDLNRLANDMSPDGVIKKYTIFKKPVYKNAPSKNQIKQLLSRYYYPYHRRLTELSHKVKLGIDCHTMAAIAPPISPEVGKERPLICLSNANETCSPDWIDFMARCLSNSFECEVSINKPFSGGYIIRYHCREIPWMQLELSRKKFASCSYKRKCVLKAFREFCRKLFQKI